MSPFEDVHVTAKHSGYGTATDDGTGTMTNDRLSLLTRHLEGHRVSVALVDGSRLDDCELVSAGRHGSQSLWLYANGSDTFVTIRDVADVWEVRPALPPPR